MTRRQQSHLVKGMGLLGERWTAGPRRWIAAGTGMGDKALRRVLLGIGGYIAWRIVSVSWKTLGATVLVVALLALRAATKAVNGKSTKPSPPAEDAQGEQQQPVVDGLPHVPRDQFLSLVRTALGTAKGVHLRTLTVPLIKRYGGAWEAADVRALCEAYGVPTRPTVRAPSGGPTVGIHRADFEALPRPLSEAAPGPDVADYIAGQSTTTSPTTSGPTTPATTTDRTIRGMRVITTDDPDNPARANVTVIDRTRKQA